MSGPLGEELEGWGRGRGCVTGKNSVLKIELESMTLLLKENRHLPLVIQN